MRVLAIGECMAELAPSVRTGEFRLGFAGDTFNTAWYLAQISRDLNIGYLTAVGDDQMSTDMRAFITASGISDDYIQTVPARTVGLYLIHLKNGERSFSYWRGQSAAKELAADAAKLDAAMSGANLIYFSGITLAILDRASRRNILAALERARATGGQIAFDPNLRPRLWETPDEMTAATMDAATLSDIVLPSFDDEAAWFGDENPGATRDRYAQAGVARIIVKNSDKPILYRWDEHNGEVGVRPISDVIDTTAAGDSFNAGFLAGVLAGNDVATAIRKGSSLARQVVQKRGALIPNLTLSETQAP